MGADRHVGFFQQPNKLTISSRPVVRTLRICKTISMSLVILGIGTATPHQNIQQQHAALLATNLIGNKAPAERTMKAIYRQTRIAQRSSVLLDEPQEGVFSQEFFQPATSADDHGPTTQDRMIRYATEATPLAVVAVEKALAKADVTAKEITHLVTCSCTGFQAPGVDIALMEELGFSSTTSRTHIGFMGCHGGFNALRVAKAYAEADREATVLIVCVELCSLHFQYTDNPQQIVANSIFADGAAAIVGRSPDHPNAPKITGWQLLDQTSTILPETADQMGWKIGDTGFEMSLSPEVPSLIGNALPDITATFLKAHGLTRKQITDWAVHPGGPRILSMVEQALQLNIDTLHFSRDVLSQYGNMSSATIFFILETLFVQAHQSHSDGLPDTCVAMAFGPGLATEIALFQQLPL